MRIIDPCFEILTPFDSKNILTRIERAGRTCYKSETRISAESAVKFIKSIIQSGHLSVIEHESITLKFICDRGVTHELVRHRLAAYSQESTRYCNYSGEKFGNEITVIKPPFWSKNDTKYKIWLKTCETCEKNYLEMISQGARPQEARSVLPNSLKTEIIMSANLREWRHVLDLRCQKAAHPQIRQLMLPLLKTFNETLTVVFSDIYEKYKGAIESPPFPLAEYQGTYST